MADLKLVGAVAIKVRPDAKGFRGETQRQVKKELAGLDATVEIHAKLTGTAATKAQAKQLKKELDGQTISWNVKLDHDSIVAAQNKLNDLLKPREKISFDLNDPAEVKAAQDRLDELKRDAKVEIKYIDDEKGYQAVLDKISALRREKLELPPISITTDDSDLDAIETQMRNKLAQIPVGFNFDNNAAGLQKTIAEIDAELAKHLEVTVLTTLDPLNLAFTRARLEAELEKQTVKIEYDENLESLRAAKARIEALLGIDKLHIETKLDEASLLEALAKVNAMIDASKTPEVEIKTQVKPEVSGPSYARVSAALRALGRNQIVQFFVRLDNSSVLLAAAKLTGLRAASRWTEELARSLGRLDRNLPIVAAVTLTLSSLSSGLLSLTASAFSLGNGLGEVVRMAGLLAPAMALGLGAVMTVATGVFKDFGAAVNGDTKAIEKLTESGKKAAAEVRVHFQDIRETISANFWKSAGDSMLNFAKTALPAVRDGLGNLATSLGGIFSRVLDSVSLFTKQDGIQVFFANLTRGFDIAQTGMASFMSGFLTLASVGSTVFPRIGKAFEAWATRFDSWVQRLAIDGTLNRWIDKGIQGLKDLVSAGGSLVGVWANIGQAAQAAGALTLHSFAQLAAKLEEATAGERFQRNMKNIFRGAREASDEFHRALGDLGPAMDVFSVTIKSTLSGAGAALGAFIDALGDVMSSPRLNVGITAFMTGLRDMFIGLRPAAAPIAEILQTFGQILGTVARDSGPLFRNLFAQLATVLTTAWHALEPFLPALIQIGTTIVNILGPAMASIAESVIPAFASGLQNIGEGLTPIIGLMAVLAASAVEFISAIPAPVLIGIATGVLAVAAAVKFAATVMPIATVAIQAMGIAAGVAAARMQLLIPVIGIGLAVATGIAVGAVAGLAEGQQSAIPHANAYADAIREDTKATEELGKVTDEAVKKLAIQNLRDSGAFRMGQQLGIDIGTITKAALGNKKAIDDVETAIARANKTYDENLQASIRANKGATSYSGTVKGSLTPSMLDNVEAGKKLLGILGQEQNSFKAGKKDAADLAEANKAAGIRTLEHAKAQEELADKAAASAKNVGAAAAASRTLTDVFSSGPAKIDAMRKSLEILTGGNAKQKAAETLGAYVKGFDDLKESVAPLKVKMQELGDAAFGETGFLNVASGNKAVLQVNQALVDAVDNIWLGAKTAYDNAIQQGRTAKDAFAEAQQFVNDHKGDFNQLAEASGVASEKVQGQLDAVFGKEWVLKISLSGLTETATIAQNMIAAVKGKWDGEAFTAFFDANPDKALKAMEDPIGAAKDWVKHPFTATFDLLPKPAQDKLKSLVGLTKEEWTDASFQTLLEVTANKPALQQALIDIRNGVEGVDIEAVVKAVTDNITLQEARNKLDELEAQRNAKVVVDAETAEANRKLDETGFKQKSLREPVPAPLIDFDTKGADDKLNATINNVDRLAGPHPVPLIDAETSGADAKVAATQASLNALGETKPKPVVDPQTEAGDQKLGTTQGFLDQLGITNPKPLVDPQTAEGDRKLSGIQGFLDQIGRSRPAPFIDAITGGASQKLSNLQAQIDNLHGKAVTMTITTRYLTSGNPVAGAGEVIQQANGGLWRNNVQYFANGGIRRFAGGGIENHVAQITRPGGPIRVWSEPETQGEAYLPYAMSKRPRSVSILSQVARDFGYDLTKTTNYANGGTVGTPAPSSHHNTASVHIGQLITTDPTEAVRKIRISQQDALAVAGISLNGA